MSLHKRAKRNHKVMRSMGFSPRMPMGKTVGRIKPGGAMDQDLVRKVRQRFGGDVYPSTRGSGCVIAHNPSTNEMMLCCKKADGSFQCSKAEIMR
jgi:hypothetical protein